MRVLSRHVSIQYQLYHRNMRSLVNPVLIYPISIYHRIMAEYDVSYSMSYEHLSPNGKHEQIQCKMMPRWCKTYSTYCMYVHVAVCSSDTRLSSCTRCTNIHVVLPLLLHENYEVHSDGSCTTPCATSWRKSGSR